MTQPIGDDAFDPAILIEVAGSYLLDQAPHLTRLHVCDAAGVDLDTAVTLWRSLGFGEAADDEVLFTDADVEAIAITQRLTELGVLQPEVMQTFVRAMGQSFARLADWQTRLLLDSLADDETAMPFESLSEIVPLVEQVQSYIWRRHLVSAASRLLLQESTDADSAPLTVGFVDIVGYTSRSRQMEVAELATLVDGFEQTVTELVVDHGGQVIKTIGDEVLYTVADPTEAGLLALALAELHDLDPSFPRVRVGTAYGTVLSRLGDVYGPVVNLAARLTSLARPGRVLVDADLARLLRDDPRFRVRRTRRTSVKGYEHLEPWALKLPKDRAED